MSRVIIETDCASFLKSIEQWDGKTPDFQSVVATAIHHAFRCQSVGDLQIVLAQNGLPMPVSTISRWADGSSQPARHVREDVVRRLKHVIEIVDAAERDERNRAIAAARGVNDLP